MAATMSSPIHFLLKISVFSLFGFGFCDTQNFGGVTVMDAMEEHEFCQWETFHAECTSPDQVLLITSAVYGRFLLGGRCIDSSYGRMDCGRDAIDAVSRNCSARRRCSFVVTSLHAGDRAASSSSSSSSCPRDLTAHLLVKHTCLKVSRCNAIRSNAAACSQTSESVRVTSDPGYLTNTDPHGQQQLTSLDSVPDQPQYPSTGRHLCGSAACPWRLHAEPGQRINLTLLHFSSADVDAEEHSAVGVVCHRFAAVREVGSVFRDLTACHEPTTAGGTGRHALESLRQRSVQSHEKPVYRPGIPAGRTAGVDGGRRGEKPVYWSETNSLQLMFYSTSNVHVIIKYEAIGCPNVRESGGINIDYTEGNRQATVSCIHSNTKWQLQCTGTQWMDSESGQLSTMDFSSCNSDTPVVDVGDSAGIVAKGRQHSSYGVLVVVGVGIILGVTIGFSMLLVVMRCIRRDSHPNALEVDLQTGVGGVASDVSSPAMQYWKQTNLTVNYDSYGEHLTPGGDQQQLNHDYTLATAGALTYDDIAKQPELFSATTTTDWTPRSCRQPDYIRQASSRSDRDCRTAAVFARGRGASRDGGVTSAMMTQCGGEHVYEPATHDVLMAPHGRSLQTFGL